MKFKLKFYVSFIYFSYSLYLESDKKKEFLKSIGESLNRSELEYLAQM